MYIYGVTTKQFYETTQNCSRKIFTNKIFHAKFLAHEIRRYPRTRTTCIVDVPKREIFEGFLQAHNPTLVHRMQELEDMSRSSEDVAEKIARSLGWSL